MSLNLSGNNLTGSIPFNLLSRAQNGLLTLSIDGYPDRNEGPKKIHVLMIVVPLIVLVVFLLCIPLFVGIIRRRRQREAFVLGASLKRQKVQFTYKELEKITNKFEEVIGKGGFGNVYHGYLENGTQVAVKMRSQLSQQAIKEFLAEAELLTMVYHKNLVTLIGYYKDDNNLAFVYEYMDQGTLQEHLSGKSGSVRPLSWGKQLQIALEAAQGLEYLHTGCMPPIIHRDVKMSNILLSQKLEAKIADFGLSRAFLNDNDTHVLTKIAASTVGYIDPAYHIQLQTNDKSGVYSYGVVLLELITGLRPILLTKTQTDEAIHITRWVKPRLESGDIASIIDPRLRGEYGVHSAWKVAELAMMCTAQEPREKATMADVVLQLRESLALEFHRVRPEDRRHSTSRTGSFELEDTGKISGEIVPSLR